MRGPPTALALASIALGIALAQCGSDGAAEPPAPDAGAPPTVGGDGGTGPTVSACSSETLAEPKTAMTYFVAANEPGADDAQCDGGSPTNEGSGRCPWKSLDAVQTKQVLVGAAGVTVALRAGTYVVKGFDGLFVQGTGKSEAERVVLTRYRDEVAILDVGAPDGAPCPREAGAVQPPECVRQVVRVAGDYVTVQGLTIQNGLAYQLEVNSGAHHLVRCNKLRETVAFDARSDQMKVDGHATDVHIEHNEFTNWRSQAIDITNVEHVYVEYNDFHDPSADGCGAAGGKYGARNVIIAHNDIHDLASPDCAKPTSYASGGGGTGSAHPDAYEAENIHIVENRFWNVKGKLAQFVSCKDCSFERNVVSNVGAGIVINANANGKPECSASATGCLPSTGLVLTGNRMKGFDGLGDPKQADIFVVVDPAAGAFTSSENIYCAEGVMGAHFGWEGALLGFAEWTVASGTDTTSAAIPSWDQRCSGW